jgi:hypothetical protein
LWFTEFGGNRIGRITTAGVITEYTVPTAASGPSVIAAGPDGALWFSEYDGNKIGRVTTSGAFAEYSIPTASGAPVGIVAGPDGALWFAEQGGNKIGQLFASILPPIGAFNDYPRLAVWPDCLYMSSNEYQFPGGDFIGTAFASFSRTDLYSGAPLTFALGFINSVPDPFTMVPTHLNGRMPAQLPPSGTPNYFVSNSRTGFAFEVRKFKAGPNCGAGGTLGAATPVSHLSYGVPPGNIVPQPGTAILLDSLDDRLMGRVQYRRTGIAESLWVVHGAVTASSTVGMLWAQINVTGGSISASPVQQQLYAPDTTLYRWMGGLAVDNQGNMSLGYSTSNGVSPNFPSIAYSGRLATDPPNTLPQSEVQLVAGAASQTHNCDGEPCSRWGEYTSMSMDPEDDCTFWYTNQYYSTTANGSSGNWQIRIGSFRFPSCQSVVKKRAGQLTSS